ncbi:cytochrome P450, partial [Mycena olivaceomarginata]
NETMRLHPPVPTNGTRQVPRDSGRMNAGWHIYIPPNSLHRTAENFSPSPDKFDPDRWLFSQTASEVLNMAALYENGMNAAHCVSKQLAWREMLMVTSTLLKRFNLCFADGFESDEWLSSLQNVFVTSIGGPLLVEISRR